MKDRVKKAYQRWINKRIPPSSNVTLTQKNIFIFPNRQALFYFLLVALVWLGATNYENNIAFAFSFLLLALFVVNILHTFNNVAGLNLQRLTTQPAFSGEFTRVGIMLSKTRVAEKHAIYIGWHKEHDNHATLSANNELYLDVPVKTLQRGLYNPGRIKINSVYPLGIIRCWCYIDLNVEILTYPKPLFSAALPQEQQAALSQEKNSIAVRGSEDFESLQDYTQGSSLRQVSWKHYAKGQGLKSKLYSENKSSQLWLRWEDFDLNTEARLSNLCYWVLELEKKNQHYGLALPGTSLSPSNGVAHKDKALKMLALYGVNKKQIHSRDYSHDCTEGEIA